MVMDEELFSLREEKEGTNNADEDILEDHEPSLSFGKLQIQNILFIFSKDSAHYKWKYYVILSLSIVLCWIM